MISIKNEHELEAMREACKITAAARALAGKMVRPGVATKAIDQAVHDYIVSQGAKPSFLNYSGYPASTRPRPPTRCPRLSGCNVPEFRG